jgi:tetratricopeptide (TPR) repeat protein
MLMSVFAAGLMAATPAANTDLAQVSALDEAPELAASSLVAGRSKEAIRVLEQARYADATDPAVLINLGIAHAQLGRDAEARALFNEALTKRAVFDLATSGGRTADSRQIARIALRMLDRGEFRIASQQAGQLTLRD